MGIWTRNRISLSSGCSLNFTIELPIPKVSYSCNMSIILRWYDEVDRSFLHRYMAMEKPWILHYIPESNWASADGPAAGTFRPKWLRPQQSASKDMYVIWDRHGVLFIDYVENARTISTSRKNCSTWRKSAFLPKQGVVLQVDEKNYKSIRQIWLPTAFTYLQTSKNALRKDIWRAILQLKINSFTRNGSKYPFLY